MQGSFSVIVHGVQSSTAEIPRRQASRRVWLAALFGFLAPVTRYVWLACSEIEEAVRKAQWRLQILPSCSHLASLSKETGQDTDKRHRQDLSQDPALRQWSEVEGHCFSEQCEKLSPCCQMETSPACLLGSERQCQRKAPWNTHPGTGEAGGVNGKQIFLILRLWSHKADKGESRVEQISTQSLWWG